uniref:Putative ovule protein n=1 Tax=Solanum chacoense TaxID=4108 RepID=A0A0V0GX70_SOLCH
MKLGKKIHLSMKGLCLKEENLLDYHFFCLEKIVYFNGYTFYLTIFVIIVFHLRMDPIMLHRRELIQ